MRRLQQCFALAWMHSAAVESFQPIHRRAISSRRPCGDSRSPSIVTALRAASLNEEELKAELSEYLKKREEADGDAAAKE